MDGNITPKKTYEFLHKYYTILDLEDEFLNIGMTEDDLFDFIKEGFPPVIYLPYTNQNNLPRHAQLALLAKKYVNYKRLTIYHIEDSGVKIPLTSEHEVGFIWYNRQRNDPRETNSSTSISETNSKGYPVEKDASKKTGRSSYSKTAQKLDILTKEHMLIQICNSVNNAIFNYKVGGKHVVPELLIGIGVKLCMDQDNSYKNEQLDD